MSEHGDGGGSSVLAARRALLRFMLGSPLLAGGSALLPRGLGAYPQLAVPEAVDEALDVFQIRAAADRRLDRKTWHFIVNGADDGQTVAANEAAYDAWQLRVRRLVDVSRVDQTVELFGLPLPSPILLAPVGGQATIDPEGELASARAAAGRGHLMVASTVSSYSIGEIRGAGSQPLWFQLYASPDRELTRKLLADAEAAGCGAVALTVDSPTRGNREAERWFSRGPAGRPSGRLGNFEGYPGPPRVGDPSLTWDIVGWLKDETRLPLLLKGIVTREDAVLAVRHGADGIIVSNHGGRQEESGRGTLECLPEVIEAVGGRCPVLLDGGIRRGTDVFKALALGARAVCIGRPYLWGLGAFGQRGVRRVLDILDGELTRIMQLAGTPSIGAIGPAYLQARSGLR